MNFGLLDAAPYHLKKTPEDVVYSMNSLLTRILHGIKSRSNQIKYRKEINKLFIERLKNVYKQNNINKVEKCETD